MMMMIMMVLMMMMLSLHIIANGKDKIVVLIFLIFVPMNIDKDIMMNL